LQHYVYCPRQAALIHLERAWRDDAATVEGNHLHAAADGGARESRGALRILRAVPLQSRIAGIAGRADVVELHRVTSRGSHTVTIDEELWHVRPVEYKRGRPKRFHEDEVQLCAQALCLEEMMHVDIPEGDLYYGKTRRRTTVRFDDELRTLTRNTCRAVRTMLQSGRTPPAAPGPKCEKCSLIEICRPYTAKSSAQRYIADLLQERDTG
jgi:CRISPR-associated exonuclease Cas4